MTIYPWLSTNWQQLQQLGLEQLPTGLILQGPLGLGLEQFAAKVAEWRLCQQDAKAPCGQCQACQLLLAGNHPDLFILRPLQEGHAIKVDAIRGLIQSLCQSAQYQRGQVVIIDRLDQLNTAAANALLKTLEEPPGQVHFLLIAENLSAIPATIISRCQRLNFVAPSLEQAEQWLKQQDPNEYWQPLIRLANGAPLAALALQQQDGLAERNSVLQHLADCNEQTDVVAVAAKLAKMNLLSVLMLWQSVILDLLKYKLSAATEQLTHQDQLPLLVSMAKARSLLQLEQMQQRVLNATRDVNHGINVNANLLLNALLLEWLC